MKLIGLTGVAGSGKDTVGQMIVDRDPRCRRVAFAEPLKKGLQAMLGLDYRHTDGELKEVPIDWLGGVTPRKLMQTLGTEWGRSIDGDIWVKAAMRQMGTDPSPVIFTDVRFENEARAIVESGGRVYRVIRSCNPVTVPSHASEQGIDGQWITASIFNDGTLAQLSAAVDEAIRPGVWR